jgi:beta-lactamase regulating signal transducer with metallopeptidase domain
MTVLLASLADAAIVLGLALAATAVLRRRSAALRHSMLATAVVTASLMPAFELLLPQVPVIRWDDSVAVSSGLTLTSGHAISGAATGETVAAPGEGIPWVMLLGLVWMAGALVTCAGLMTGLVRLARLRARCTPVTGRWRELTDELSRQCGVARHVAVLQSEDSSLLVTCGMLNPTIILPAGASRWTDDRRRIVLRHELAHIRRHDAAVQVAGEALRVLHWLNPLVWVACRRLRQESEYACDDAVLSGGVEATEYATHLLDIAKHLSGRHAAWTSAAAIAHPSTLERRIVAMLHRHQNRAPVSRRVWSAAALVAVGIGIPLAAAGVAPAEHGGVVQSEARDVTLPAGAAADDTRTQALQVADARPPASPRVPAAAARTRRAAAARQATATIAGALLDQSGAALPGAELTLTETQTGTQLMQRTDAAGRFAFRDLPPARYELVARLPGFTSVSQVLTVSSGAALERTITMPLGSIRETITLLCSATPAANGAARLQQFVSRSIVASVFPILSAQEPAPSPIRVGGNVRPPRKIRDVKPVCPPTGPVTDATVRITGRVGVDGMLNNVTPVPAEPSGGPPTELTESALDALRQWKFTPTLLNGLAVEVDITVDVVFKRW